MRSISARVYPCPKWDLIRIEMIMMGAEADESTLLLVPYEPAIVKRYRPMSVRRSAFSVRRSAFKRSAFSDAIISRV